MNDFPLNIPFENEIVLTNAKLVLADEVVSGTIQIKQGQITAIDHSGTAVGTSIDFGGDYVCPGLVELHTDNLERHLQPRPGVKWPLKAAILSHDAELASVGITTVFDALRVGSIPSDKRTSYAKYAPEVANIILELQKVNRLRVGHFLHLRAEICTETLLEELAEFKNVDRVGIVSLMDHTPYQRQFRDVAKMEEYLIGKYGMSQAEVKAHFDHLIGIQKRLGPKHELGASEFGKSIGAVLASHDDTTLNDVESSVAKGVQVAEFPTTLEAAKASSDAGVAVMMGAPNLLRGSSHSGNIAAQELVDHGILDILSSDYAPSSLLMGAVRLGLESGNMAVGINKVTRNPARSVNLTDRGSIEVGLRADLVRFATEDGLPFIKGVWRQGTRTG